MWGKNETKIFLRFLTPPSTLSPILLNRLMEYVSSPFDRSPLLDFWIMAIFHTLTIVIFFSHQTLNFLLWCFFKVQIQLLFIADLRHKKMRLPTAAASSSRTATTSMTSTKSVIKPGRQTVTFLLVCNLGLWITYNFEMQKVIILIWPDQK